MNQIRVLLWAIPAVLCCALVAGAEVIHQQINEENFVTSVKGEAWQPDEFDEALIVKARRVQQAPAVDGSSDDPVWADAQSVTVPLSYGSLKEASIKSVYTESEVYLLVSWPDATKDDQHHPWVWDAQTKRYVEGPQVEDSIIVSFEAGCEWTPSLLSGYVYDFDGWRWLAARSDPIGQAVDTAGHVQHRWMHNQGYKEYRARNDKPFWNLKFIQHGPGLLTKPWYEIDRIYQLQPVAKQMFVSYRPDRFRPSREGTVFAEKLPAPDSGTQDEAAASTTIGAKPAHAAVEPLTTVPQYKPVKLTGDAGEVAAKGQWKDGRWTVEFGRVLITPARTKTDAMFERVTQFSIHVFDHTERVDESSESGRLFLHFQAPDTAPEAE